VHHPVCPGRISPAILTKSGELYTPLSAQLSDRDERRRLLAYAGKYVRATGRLFERGGTQRNQHRKNRSRVGLVMPNYLHVQ
jgi:hypothetical protein